VPSQRAGWSRRSKWLKWLTYAISPGAFAYVLLKLNFTDLREAIQHDLVAGGSGILLQIAPRVVQAWRWATPAAREDTPARVAPRDLCRTLMNGILRCAKRIWSAVSWWPEHRTGNVRVLSSQAVERAADGVALVLVAWLASVGCGYRRRSTRRLLG